jgi:hypothetical protein
MRERRMALLQIGVAEPLVTNAGVRPVTGVDLGLVGEGEEFFLDARDQALM